MPGPLSTVGEGLLGTHVAWEDIQFEIQKSLNTTATFGPNKTLRDAGDGNGFLSRVCLIYPDWQNGTPNLPEKFIVKILSPLPLIEETGISSVTDFAEQKSPELLRVEVEAYRLLSKYGDESFFMGKVLGHRPLTESNNSKGFLIMEYIENVVPVHILENISVENCREVLKVVAKWQAVSLKHSEEFENSFEHNLLTELLGGDVIRNTFVHTIENLEKLRRPDFVDKLEKLTKISAIIGSEENLRKLDELSKELKMKDVFANADLWNPNILWGRKNDGELFLKAVVDYQLGCLTNSMLDVTMFLVCHINADVRRANTKQFIQDFHGYLTTEMNGRSPFTIEQLEECYNRLYPMAALLVYTMVASVYLSKIEKNHGDSEKLTEVLENKIIATLDEVISLYENDEKLT